MYSSMESLLKKLEHEVTCTICEETFRTPKTLPCLHTFCCECLNRHLRYRKGAKLPINCPICRAEIQAPNGDNLDHIPTSFYHNRLLETLSIKQCSAGSDITCGNCKKLTSESSYCFECAKFFCTDCLNAHNLLGFLNENHRVIAVKEFCPQDYEALLQRQPFCQQQYHKRKVLRYFCIQCEKCICQVCQTVEHNGHKVEHLEKAAEDQKQVIQSVLERADKKIEVYKETTAKTDQVSAELEANVSAARRELRQTVEKIKRAIDEVENETVAELVNIQHERQGRLNEIKGMAEARLKVLSESMEYTKTMRNEGTSAEILQMKDALQQRFQELLKSERDENRLRDGDSFIKFHSNRDIKLPILGHVQTNVIQPSLSVLTTTPPNAQASKEVKLVVTTKGPNGEVCYIPETHLEVVVEPRYDVTEFNTIDKGDGEYHVTFRPQIPGNYSVGVKIENNRIQNSPQTLNVKPRELVQVAELELRKPYFGENVRPSGVAVSKDGDIAIVDQPNGRVLMYSKEGEFLREFGHQGSGYGELSAPCAAAFTADGELVIGDQANNRAQAFDGKTGELVRCFGKKGTGNGEFKNPTGVSVDSDGRIIVCDFCNHRVQVFDRLTNHFLFKFGDTGDEKLYYPSHSVFHNDMFFVSDSGNNCIKVFDNKGKFLYKFGKSGTGDGELRRPLGLCVDRNNTLIVCNRDNPNSNCVQMFTLDGRFVGRSVHPINNKTNFINNCSRVARFPDGTIVVTLFPEGRVCLLK